MTPKGPSPTSQSPGHLLESLPIPGTNKNFLLYLILFISLSVKIKSSVFSP